MVTFLMCYIFVFQPVVMVTESAGEILFHNMTATILTLNFTAVLPVNVSKKIYLVTIIFDFQQLLVYPL